MHFINYVPKETWQFITHFGSTGALLPLLLTVAFGLWLDDWKRVVIVWLVGMAAGVLIASATVIAFAGWGLGIAVLDFTGVSGHAMLAFAVLPIPLACLFRSRADWNGTIGLALGLLLGMLIGWSRIVLGAHSWSEVVSGGCLGAAISGVAWQAMRKRWVSSPDIRWTRLAVVPCTVLVLTMHQAMDTALPTHNWLTWLALELSGNDRPFVRSDLHQAKAQSWPVIGHDRYMRGN
jgi:membrane-associated phospholipid phosphatase